MNIIIDGNKIKNKEDLHNQFKTELHLNDDYGNNLDALNDVLYMFNNLEVSFIHTSTLISNLEGYFFKLLIVLQDNNVEIKICVN